MHRQTWVKVNARIDERVAEIVQVLNSVPNLQTVDSCQGNPGEAYVYFWLDGWEPTARFLFEVIQPSIRGVDACVISIESLNGSRPIGKISFKAESCEAVLSALKEVLPVSARRSACSGDSERRELHN